MRTIKGALTVILDDDPEDMSYPAGEILTYTLDHVMPRAISVDRRIVVRYINQTGGDYVAIIGAEFSSATGDNLKIQVVLPAQDGFQPDWMFKDTYRDLGFLYDWLAVHAYTRVEELIRLGAGLLVVDRIRVHPVDARNFAYETAIAMIVNLLAHDLDQMSDDAIREILAAKLKPVLNKPDAVPGLIAALSHERKGIRERAAYALNQFQTPEATAALEAYKNRGHQ